MIDLNLSPGCEQMSEPAAGGGPQCSLDYVRLERCLRAFFSFMIIDELDAFSQPFIRDANADYVTRTGEVIRRMRRSGGRLISWQRDTPLLGDSPILRFFKRILLPVPVCKCAGATAFWVS
jgi:hypothetical protein